MHVINVTTIDGLFDIITLGNLIEFSAALDARTYALEPLSGAELQERRTAILRYHTFIALYAQEFCLVIDGMWVNPAYIFRKQLVDFGCTILKYFQTQEPLMDEDEQRPGLTSVLLHKCLSDHITQNWLDL